MQLTVAFFLGRLVSYTLYLGGAALAEESLGDAIVDSLTSPTGIAVQVVLLAGIVALVELDWTRWLPKPRTPPQNDDGRP